MIKLFRIDHRLLHGQVGFSWVRSIGADCILIADDDSATDSLSVADAKRICDAIPEITSINLGGIKKREGARQVSQAIFLLPEEEDMLHELGARGIELEIRQVPTETKTIYA